MKKMNKPFWGLVSLVIFYVCFAVGTSFVVWGLKGCSPSDPCDTDDATRCDDNAVMRCVGGSWEDEEPCDTITTLSGDTYPGVCCVDDNGAYCAEECE